MAKTFVTWVALMDDRTTVTCMDVHGQVVSAGEHFITMAGAMDAPPAHWGCRSVLDVRTLTVTDEVTGRDPNNEGRRFERDERQLARRALTDRRQEIGPERYRKQLDRARQGRLPPGIEYRPELTSRGPLRLLERFVSSQTGVTLGPVA